MWGIWVGKGVDPVLYLVQDITMYLCGNGTCLKTYMYDLLVKVSKYINWKKYICLNILSVNLCSVILNWQRSRSSSIFGWRRYQDVLVQNYPFVWIQPSRYRHIFINSFKTIYLCECAKVYLCYECCAGLNWERSRSSFYIWLKAISTSETGRQTPPLTISSLL